jgi:hypothetical protein
MERRRGKRGNMKEDAEEGGGIEAENEVGATRT